MKVKSTAKFVRGSARKARIPADVVRGMSVEDALPVLKYMPKKAAHDVYKVIHTAKSDAVNNYGLNEDGLWISEIRIDEGPRLRRLKPGSRGRGNIVAKKLCHISVVVTDESPDGIVSMTAPKTETKAKSKAKSQTSKQAKPKTKAKNPASPKATPRSKKSKKAEEPKATSQFAKQGKRDLAGGKQKFNDPNVAAPVSQGTRRRGDR